MGNNFRAKKSFIKVFYRNINSNFYYMLLSQVFVWAESCNRIFDQVLASRFPWKFSHIPWHNTLLILGINAENII